MGDSNAHRCCCAPCADGGNCSLPHNHAGEHYSDKETMLDFLNPARHVIAAKDAEIAALKAEVAVRDGSWCEQNRKEGRGGCGMCAWCCKDAREQRDALAIDLAAHKRALAAGPTRLRALRSDDYSPGYVAGLVEAAQEAALKEGT